MRDGDIEGKVRRWEDGGTAIGGGARRTPGRRLTVSQKEREKVSHVRVREAKRSWGRLVFLNLSPIHLLG